MNQRTIFALTTMALLGLAVTLPTGDAFAQTAKDIVGTWKQVTNINIAPDGRRSEPFGPNPNSIVTFDANGRFASIQKVEGSTWPNWTGTDQKRPIISFTGDDMKLAVPAASLGGTGEVIYKRIK
jgi:hypothetical protein